MEYGIYSFAGAEAGRLGGVLLRGEYNEKTARDAESFI